MRWTRTSNGISSRWRERRSPPAPRRRARRAGDPRREAPALIAADREVRVGSTHHATVERVDDRDHVIIEPLPDLTEVLGRLVGPLVVLDTETTGLHRHNGDRLISLAVLPLDRDRGPGEERVTFAAYRLTVNPGRPSSPQALAVHGLTEAELATKPALSRAMASQVVRFIGGSTVVAHNTPFDAGFVQSECERLGMGWRPDEGQVVDTRLLCKLLWPGEPGSLDALATRLGVDRGDRDAGHDALADARLLARCLPGLVEALVRHIHGKAAA
ncbi:exonuclease domain-containing protein [Methylobacterium tardum]|uniref:exonuclease domain-containing protein n=1 Tax=Methylobacterium tardum TaxID=374432 RepID=UPI001EDED821|nr:exonuclease domain-containing protein [Methylobacterium tardum]